MITQNRPARTALRTLILTEGIPLVIAHLRVHDDLEDRTFDVNLDDVVQAIDDPNRPGGRTALRSSPCSTPRSWTAIPTRRSSGSGPSR